MVNIVCLPTIPRRWRLGQSRSMERNMDMDLKERNRRPQQQDLQQYGMSWMI